MSENHSHEDLRGDPNYRMPYSQQGTNGAAGSAGVVGILISPDAIHAAEVKEQRKASTRDMRDVNLDWVDDPDLQDPNKLYVPSTNAHDHSVTVTIRLRSQEMSELQLIIQSQKWPWLHVQQIIRWTLRFGLDKIHKAWAPPQSYAQTIARAEQLLRDHEYQLMFDSHLLMLEQQYRQMLVADASGRMARRMLVEQRALLLKGIEEGAPDAWDTIWHIHHLQEFDRRYGTVLGL